MEAIYHYLENRGKPPAIDAQILNLLTPAQQMTLQACTEILIGLSLYLMILSIS